MAETIALVIYADAAHPHLDPGADRRVRPGRDDHRDHPARLTATMFESLLVGTDGSDAAGVAVARAVAMASALGARLQIVSAYEPVPERRLRVERVHVPSDVQVNVRDEVLALLERAREDAAAAGVRRIET